MGRDDARAAKLRLILEDTGMDLGAMMRWAEGVAAKVAARIPELADELPGAAMLGLAEAIERYDPEPRAGHDRPPRFRAFARPIIHGRVIDEVRSWLKDDGVRPALADELARRWPGPRGATTSDPGVLGEDGVSRRMRQPPMGDAPARWFGPYIEEAPDRPHRTAEELAEARDAAEILLSTCDAETAALLRSIYIEGMTWKDAAGRLGIPFRRASKLVNAALESADDDLREIVLGGG